jgi:PEP-CTERM motif-containing protein
MRSRVAAAIVVALVLAPGVAAAAVLTITESGENVPIDFSPGGGTLVGVSGGPVVDARTPELLHLRGILVIDPVPTGATGPLPNATSFAGGGTSTFYVAEPPVATPLTATLVSDRLDLAVSTFVAGSCPAEFTDAAGRRCQVWDITFTSDTEAGSLGFIPPNNFLGGTVVLETGSPIILSNQTTTSLANFFPPGSLSPFTLNIEAAEAAAVPEPGTLMLLALGSFSAAAVRRRIRR